MKNVSIICFSFVCVFLVGCSTYQYGGGTWPTPKPPVTKHVVLKTLPDDGGFSMDNQNAENLVDNVDELKAYIKKLEVLVEAMKKYYESR